MLLHKMRAQRETAAVMFPRMCIGTTLPNKTALKPNKIELKARVEPCGNTAPRMA